MDVLKTFLTLPPPDPNQPGLFRLAKPKDLLGIAEQAGLQGIADEEVSGESYFDSVDEYFASLMEMAAPLQPLFCKLSTDQGREAETGIKGAAGKYRRGDEVALPMAIRVVVARKPF